MTSATSHGLSALRPVVVPFRYVRLTAVLVAWGMLITACGVPIGVKRVDPRTAHRTLTSNVLSSGKLSRFTQNVLYQRDLVARFDDAPEQALAELHAVVAAGRGGRDDVFALAELSFFYAEESGKQSYDLAAAVYAWAFLFPDVAAVTPSPFDARFRLACDLYNRALTEGLESKARREVELRAGTYELPFGRLDVGFDTDALRWGDRRLVGFIPVADLEVRGLPTRHRQPGLGAPLAAKTEALDPDQPSRDMIAPRVRVPVTALLRLEGAERQLAVGRVHATLELYAPSGINTVTIAGERVPLEIESTATLASMLAELPAWKQEISRFLKSIGTQEKGLRLAALQPYRPGLIPVVFVHGTASSAPRWAQVLNELENDPRIRDRFQFWFFSYDTGNPIAYSAMLLREALTDAVQRLDPEGTNPALRRMVVIGHSQGGLLTKAIVVDSGSRFWDNVSRKPLDALDLDGHTRDLLRRTMFMQPLPFVRRVVFVATPQRGSYVAGSWLAHQAARLVSFPLDLARLTGDVLKRDRDALALAGPLQMPTSVENMTPGNRFIQTLATLPVAPGVGAHSIIAVQGNGPLEKANDGVVQYQSAHIEGVDSELVVRSGHSCQDNPHTIEEIRRILLLHLEATGDLAH
jgi:pimeloyl-ACP methyl ester carboxylesterase